MALNGIDISNHQAGLNLAKVPCDFVICKATEGTSFVDKYCDGFIQKALKLNKKVGVYHFASGRSSGKAEADFFLKHVQGYVGKAILILDWEADAVSKGVSYAKEFLDRVKEKTGIKPMLYSYNNCVNAYDWSAVANAGYTLWNAGYYAGKKEMGYNAKAPLKGGTGAWSSCAIYQYTDSGKLNGWSGHLDLNVFYGSEKEWDAIAGNNKEEKQYMFKPLTCRVGDENTSVLLLQEVLKARGYYKGDLDRSFGKATMNAVNKYQVERMKQGKKLGNGKGDGICGQDMWRDLIAI